MRLTMKEQRRIEVIQGVMGRRVAVEDGGRVLGRSVRTIFRMVSRLREQGLQGLIHGNRGRKSPRRIPDRMREKMVAMAKGKYRDVNDTHFRELLAREEKVEVGRSTLRRILRTAGIAPKRKRRSPRYRRRRERREVFGMMLQIDASAHDWLEGRGPELTLVGAIDDATGFVWVRFESAETTWAYLRLMEAIFASHGLPVSLYSDRHSIFHALKEPTIIEQLQNTRPLTQFGRAMEEVGITILKAWTPQAKGRIERLWETFQDRLVVELRLKGASTLEEANQVLPWFLPLYNRRFTVKATKVGSFFHQPPSPSKLNRILCLKETRVVNKDHTISFDGLILQIPPSSRWASIAGQSIDVLQLKDGSVEIMYKQLVVARFSPSAITRLAQQKNSERSQLQDAA